MNLISGYAEISLQGYTALSELHSPTSLPALLFVNILLSADSVSVIRRVEFSIKNKSPDVHLIIVDPPKRNEFAATYRTSATYTESSN